MRRKKMISLPIINLESQNYILTTEVRDSSKSLIVYTIFNISQQIKKKTGRRKEQVTINRFRKMLLSPALIPFCSHLTSFKPIQNTLFFNYILIISTQSFFSQSLKFVFVFEVYLSLTLVSSLSDSSVQIYFLNNKSQLSFFHFSFNTCFCYFGLQVANRERSPK